MRSLFREDSGIRQALASLADDLLYSVLTLICSVPVITAGAAFTALFDLIMRAETRRGYGAGVYFQRFGFHFRRATVSWSCLLLLDAALFFGIRFTVTNGEQFRTMLWGLLFFACWMLLLLHFYLPPLLTAERSDPLFTLWKTALFTGIALLPRSFLMLLITAVPGLFYIYLPEFFWNISFFWVFFWPAIAARLFFTLIRKYFPEFAVPATEEADGPEAGA